MKLYQISEAAADDWQAIINYTLNRYGEAQTRKYMSALEKSIEQLALGEGFYKNLDGLYPGMRSTHCQHHYVFGLMRNHALMLVVAILHERMDLMVRLKERLN